MDAQLVEKIVHEVKSQGVFDEFRRDSMADVDTKPAYQNLRQRVERSVKKFLAEQTWTPETNKNQLREKLRRHITESGYLDVGVERIVDQVVNPKVRSVFQPRIEEITYKYLGIPQPPKESKPPPPPLMHPLPPLPLNRPALKVETCNLLPNGLEQVSPDSDKATVKSENLTGQCDMDCDLDRDQDDDEESPPFEPLIATKSIIENNKKSKDDMCGDTKNNNKEKSNESESNEIENLCLSEIYVNLVKNEKVTNSEKDLISSIEIQGAHDSILSNISNESSQEMSKVKSNVRERMEETAADANISEEAQMPKFGENSNELTEQRDPNNAHDKDDSKLQLHFDINKDEIKFEGTGRKPIVSERTSPPLTPLKNIEEKESLCARDVNDDVKQTKSAFVFDTGDIIRKSKSISIENEFVGTFNTQHSVESCADDSISTDYTELKSTDVKKTNISGNSKDMKYSNSVTSSPNLSPINSQVDRKSEYSSKQSSPSSSSSTKKHSRKHSRSKNKIHHDSHRSRNHTDERNKQKHSHEHHHRHHHYHRQQSHHQHHSDKYESGRQSKISSKDTSSSSIYKHKSTSKESKSSLSKYEEQRSSNAEEKVSSHSEQSLSMSSLSVKRNKIKDDHHEVKSKLHKRNDFNDGDDDDKPSSGQQSSNVNNALNGNSVKTVALTTSSSSAAAATTTTSSSSSSSSTATTKVKSKANIVETQQVAKMETTISDTCEFNKSLNDECVNNSKYINNNVVILNDVLVNHLHSFVDINFERSTNTSVCSAIMASQNNNNININNNNIELSHKMSKESELFHLNNVKHDFLCLSENTLFLEIESAEKFNVRLNLIKNALELCKDSLNYFNTTECNNDVEQFKYTDDDNECRNDLIQTKNCHDVYNNILPKKRLKLDNNVNDNNIEAYIAATSRMSPVPSECSVNSNTENEGFCKNINNVTESKETLNVANHRCRSVQKLTQQQRYTNDDLYKPRPILSQRTRRRGMDSII